jgi:murein DD-endopeptidase MepM/ murein hydrolase activator NlpD
VVPAAVAVLAVWSAANLPQLLGAEHAGGLVKRAAGADLELSAPGAGSSPAARLAAADGRVSRYSRSVTLPGRAASPMMARPAPKPVERWFRPSAGVESSCFCMRWGVMHEGIDLAGPLGSPIVAVGDGVVVEAGPAEGFGLWVVIRHDNGDYSIYGHMYRYYVKAGQRVRAGQHIADIGSNGHSTGPHLHFAITQGSVTGPYLDPVPWLKARGINIGRYDPDA